MRKNLARLVATFVEALQIDDQSRLAALLDPRIDYHGYGDDAEGTAAENVLGAVQTIRASDPRTRFSLSRTVLDAKAREAVAFIVGHRSDDTQPSLDITVWLTVGPNGLITGLTEQHHDPNRKPRGGCPLWRLKPETAE